MTRSGGRPQATSRAELSARAIDLFTARGFEETSVDDVATSVGIARRTLFRYFPSKNAIPWGDYDAHLDEMRGLLADLPPGLALGEELKRALLAFNEAPPEESERHRRRMTLILRVPALQAHSMLMYDEWRQIIAEHVARRLGTDPTAHVPQTIAWQLLGTALAAYEQWLDDPDSRLPDLLTAGCAILSDGIAALTAGMASGRAASLTN